jgi:hypothetical protein
VHRETYDLETFRNRFGPWALVAGGSDGIGESFVRQLAGRGLNVVVVARRPEGLARVTSAIESEFGVQTRAIATDLTNDGMLSAIVAGTSDLDVGLLVYNAGSVHKAMKFLDRPIDDALGLIRLNCRGPALLAHWFGNRMRERGRGGILFMTSLAALGGSSYTATYNSTKSFDLILAESLWHELAPEQIDVMAVIAGATRTPSMQASNDHFEKYPGIMDSDEVTRGALAHLGQGPAWVAGDGNRQQAREMQPADRVAQINRMSSLCASLYGLPHVEAKGASFGELR